MGIQVELTTNRLRLVTFFFYRTGIMVFGNYKKIHFHGTGVIQTFMTLLVFVTEHLFVCQLMGSSTTVSNRKVSQLLFYTFYNYVII